MRARRITGESRSQPSKSEYAEVVDNGLQMQESSDCAERIRVTCLSGNESGDQRSGRTAESDLPAEVIKMCFSARCRITGSPGLDGSVDHQRRHSICSTDDVKPRGHAAPFSARATNRLATELRLPGLLSRYSRHASSGSAGPPITLLRTRSVDTQRHSYCEEFSYGQLMADGP